MGENLAATCLDMAWHCLSPSEVPTAEEAPAFEKKVLAEIGLLTLRYLLVIQLLTSTTSGVEVMQQVIIATYGVRYWP